ncbi:MAG: hypothetical protein ACXQS6_02200 [Candidatus Syntropharchaeales archaeon]
MRDGYEVVAINYWREVRSNFKRTLLDFNDILLLIHDSAAFDDLIRFLNILPYYRRKTYISLTRTFSTIKPSLKKFDTRMYIIDCISKSISDRDFQNGKSWFFEDMSFGFSEISRLIDKYLKKLKPELVVVDSISQLIDFSVTAGDRDFNNFINHLRKRNSETLCNFVLLYDNQLKSLRNLPISNINLILRLEVIKDKIHWRE